MTPIAFAFAFGTTIIVVLLFALTFSASIKRKKIENPYTLLYEAWANSEQLQNKSILDSAFVSHIGDYMHNFGDGLANSFTIDAATVKRLGKLFLAVRYVADNADRLGADVDFRILDEVIDIPASLKHDLLDAIRRAEDPMERKKMLYNLVLTGFKQILPAITNGRYEFDDSHPQTLGEFKSQQYVIR